MWRDFICQEPNLHRASRGRRSRETLATSSSSARKKGGSHPSRLDGYMPGSSASRRWSPRTGVFVHGDLQMSNVLVDNASCAYLALIDWGGARRGNAADDFSVVPLAAVGPMLEGYRELMPAEPVTTEASILWRRIQLILGLLPRAAAPGWAWAERPVGRLIDMFLHFHQLTPVPWRELGPSVTAGA